MNKNRTIFWFRRDLRLEDNTGLHAALEDKYPVRCIFIFDTDILNKLTKNDLRVSFIHQEIERLNAELKKHNSALDVYYGEPKTVFRKLIKNTEFHALYCNRDYEPYARKRDEEVSRLLEKHNIKIRNFKDQVIFDTDDIVKPDGKPYTVFTPYSKKWLQAFSKITLKKESNSEIPSNFEQFNSVLPSLEQMGFMNQDFKFPEKTINQDIIQNYHNTRDFMGIAGTSRLSLHLRFGTISIRQLVKLAFEINSSYLNELIWREFYMAILWHFPKVETENFKPQYNFLEWQNNEKDFERWCKGKTGYPIVDAGMRELNETGFMHNRARMITASFLTKHLLIDWRWGEQYFADKLLDYDLSANNGGWQWAASTGCDAVPYFRIFNPESQQKKFDPDGVYVKKWVPEADSFSYSKPIIDHKFARERALNTYKKANEEFKKHKT